jgi:deazaflavin-dependent oxidoreductase (nitroreductase family)
MNAQWIEAKLFSFFSRLLSKDVMRPFTRLGTNAHVVLYRLTGGKAQIAKYPTMLLTVKGRKSGKLRTVPVVYIMDGDRYVIAAAYAGSDHNPTWWLNLQASGEAVLEVMRKTVKVRAHSATDEERVRLWPQLIDMYPYFTDYQTRTKRQIPIVILTPIPN